jgi:hypothetical protein
MPNDSIFEFADKFGYVSPFGNWVQEEKEAREERERNRQKQEVKSGGVYISHRDEAKKIVTVRYFAGKLYKTKDGKPTETLYEGDNPFIQSIKIVIDALLALGNVKINEVVTSLLNSEIEEYNIQNFDLLQDGKPKQHPGSYTIMSRWQKNGALIRLVNDPKVPLIYNLGHELKHAYNIRYGLQNYNFIAYTPSNPKSTKIMIDELDCVNFENIIRADKKESLRTEFGHQPIPPSFLISPSSYDNFKPSFKSKK